jgi:hypothetical protein
LTGRGDCVSVSSYSDGTTHVPTKMRLQDARASILLQPSPHGLLWFILFLMTSAALDPQQFFNCIPRHAPYIAAGCDQDEQGGVLAPLPRGITTRQCISHVTHGKQADKSHDRTNHTKDALGSRDLASSCDSMNGSCRSHSTGGSGPQS